MTPHPTPTPEHHDLHWLLHSSHETITAYRQAFIEIVTPMVQFNQDLVHDMMHHWWQAWSALAYMPDIAAGVTHETPEKPAPKDALVPTHIPIRSSRKKIAALMPHAKGKGVTAAHRHIATNPKKRADRTKH